MPKLCLLAAVAGLFALAASRANGAQEGDELFSGAIVPRIRIEISPESMTTLREYQQVWRQPRPERIDVQATIREGAKTYTNVAIHLKGSYSFQPVDEKPSLTVNFDKFVPGQRFHGLDKLHLNNSVQDPSYLCEQLARELFVSVGVPAPRAGQARVSLNGRDVGLFVLVEGANKGFVKRNFPSAKGNLYDGGSGGDVTRALEADSGGNPEDRSDLTNLVNAAREPDPTQRLARLAEVLDVERFVSFAATEAFIVHWDGYAFGCNNYRLFHDVSRDKMVFMPGGLDQLFGVSSSTGLTLTPVFKGMVAKALFCVPTARQSYLARIEQLSTNEFRVPTLHAHVDRLAARIRAALAGDPRNLAEFEEAVRSLKSRIKQRAAGVALQLKNPKRPLQFDQDTATRLPPWNFRPGPTRGATGSRVSAEGRQILAVTGTGSGSSGAWRATVLLDAGHYEFTGKARTKDMNSTDAKGTNGVILRVSGERSTKGITISDDWTKLSYEFDVHGIEDVELACEFRGGSGACGYFDDTSHRLARKGQARLRRPTAARQEPDPP